MRKIIAWEGEEKIPGQVLETGALKWNDDKPIPVTKSADWDVTSVIGTATDLRREDNHTITAEIELNEEFAPAIADMSFTVYCNQVKGSDVSKEPWRISSARIRAIFFAPTVPW